MYAPISGNISYPDSPLQGSALQLSFELPRWFNTTPGKSVLGNILSILGETVDYSIEAVSDLYSSIIPGNGNTLVPRLAYLSTAPSSLSEESTYTNNRTLQGFYRPSQSNLPWQSLWAASEISELVLSEGPCFFLYDNQILFKNLEKQLIYSTGNLFYDAEIDENFWSYSITGTVSDCSLLTSVNPLLPPNKWDKHFPEEYIRNNVLNLSVSGCYFWLSPLSNVKNFDILLVSHLSSAQITAYPVDLENYWDRQAFYVNLIRLPSESNYDLKTRIQNSSRFGKSIDRNSVLFKTAIQLGLIDFYVWDGISDLTLKNTYSRIIVSGIPKVSWNTETLSLGSDTLGTYYTSSNRNHNQSIYYLDGRVTTPLSTDNNLIRFNNQYEFIESPGIVIGQFSYTNWSISGNTVYASGNLPKSTYYIAAIKKIDLNSLTSDEIHQRLYDNYSPTPFGRAVFNYHRQKYPVSYGNCKWGVSRFFTSSEVVPYPSLIPYSFED